QLGLDANGAPITTGYQIYGMFELAGTNNLYFNSVYVGGSGVIGTGQSTFAFVSNVTSGARNYMDNIFWNARSTGSGTGNNFAIALSGPGFTSNYNDLYATGTNGFVGAFLTNDVPLVAWQADTGQDGNSISIDPQYINPNGNAATGDLHIFGTSPCVGAGLTIAGITNDFDNDPRLNPPAIGADQPPAAPSPTPTATFTPTPTATATFTPTATATFTPTATATATFTPTATATPTGSPSPCSNYTFSSGSDPIVPGTTDTGNHTDDGDTFVALPFSFSLYDQSFNGVNVSSNGRLDFVCANE